MIQQGAAFCVALPYKDGLSVNEIGSMREFQKIQMEWLGMPVQMNAGRGMDYFCAAAYGRTFYETDYYFSGKVQ